MILQSTILMGQVLETKNWCLSQCDIAGDERENTELIYLRLKNDSIQQEILKKDVLKFPLRIAIIQQNTAVIELKEIDIRKSIENLNNSFEGTGFLFYIEQVDVIISDLKIEDVSKDAYQIYNEFSDSFDLKDIISLYIFDQDEEFCQISETSISCARTGGFSYILSKRTANLVLSRFDITDRKTVAHEFGHFFGLYHTFEEDQYGKDNFKKEECQLLGDRICDTPPDPGTIYEIYVDYSNCELKILKNEEGFEYKPLIQNYMSYYKPCYLKEYSFTIDQIKVMSNAGYSNLRVNFSRK
jgi:hypothetical protein